MKQTKIDFEVGIRPRQADCSHSDYIIVPAFSAGDAVKRVNNMIRNGVHTMDGRKDYIVKSVISPSDEIYGLDEPCDCGRASAYIGCSYII